MIDLEKTEAGFGYMIQAYKTGGPYMHFITIFGLFALAIAIWKIVRIGTKKDVDFRFLELIRMFGSLAVATGFLSQIIGIVLALEAIRAAADISPEIVLGGAIVSFYAPIWGFMVFIFSIILYYSLKEIIKTKSPV